MADRQHAPRVPAPPVQQPAPAPRASAPVHHSGAAARASATGRFLKGPPTVRLSASPAPPVSRWSSAGAPLPSTTRQRLENSFSLDLSPVRVHSDSHASGVADSMRAYAFAYGSHIFLGSGQSAYNLGLMAHEVTHVVQQQGRPAFQMSSALAVGDRFESEAGSVSAAVVRGEHALVHERTGIPRFQGSLWDRVTGAVGSAVSAVGRGVTAAAGAVVSAVAEIGSGLLNAAYNYLKGRARSIPGYDLLGFVLGRDPITQEPIERNASNLIHAVLGLIPGGAEMWTNLQQANVINRVFEWLDPELAKLNLTWPIIRGLFQQAWNAFSLADAVANPGRVWDAMRDIFAPPLGRLVNFARAAGGKILEFIFEGALALGGSAAQRVLAIFRRGQAVFRLIVADPMRFVRNLVAAGVGGFRRFAANILDHLRTALFEWLLGALAGAGLQLPQRWDFMGILSVVLQVLGLTYARIRERFVRLIGEPAVRAIEVGFEFLRIIVTQGLAAAWEKILEFATGMIDTVIEGIKSWVVRSIVGAAVTRLATMFNPVGAVIQAIIATYNTVMFFIERANQIATMVESYLTSIENIAQGNLEAAMAYVERAMARTLPVIISFLARLIGLGGISDTIRGIIQRIQATVDRAIDRVITWVRERAAAILARVTGRGAAAPGQAGVATLSPARFSVHGESHQITVQLVGGRPTPMLASTPVTVVDYITRLEQRIANIPPADPMKAGLVSAMGTVKTMSNQLTASLGSAQGLNAPRREDVEGYQRLVTRIHNLLDLISEGAHTGTASDPIPLVWFKPWPNYRPILLRVNDSDEVYRPNAKRTLPVPQRFEGRSIGGGIEIGVDQDNRPADRKPLTRLGAGESRRARVTRAAEQFVALLRAFGFSWSGFNADHVKDLGLGGFDEPDNLWPLDAASNSRGNEIYRQYVWVLEGANIRVDTVENLAGKHFVIRRIQ